MLPAYPAIVRPAELHAASPMHTEVDLRSWLIGDHEPTAADLAEMDLAAAIQHPDVRRLLIAAREVMRTNGRYGMARLTIATIPFRQFAVDDPDEEPARELSSEPPPF